MDIKADLPFYKTVNIGFETSTFNDGETLYFGSGMWGIASTVFNLRRAVLYGIEPYRFVIKEIRFYIVNTPVFGSSEDWNLNLVLDFVPTVIGPQTTESSPYRYWVYDNLDYDVTGKTVTLTLDNPNWAVNPSDGNGIGQILMEIQGMV